MRSLREELEKDTEAIRDGALEEESSHFGGF